MKKMSALLLILGFCALAADQVHASGFEASASSNSYADFFPSCQNVERMEKISSLLALVMWCVMYKDEYQYENEDKAEAFYIGLLAINIALNVALGCGYKKDKKAFARTLIPIPSLLSNILKMYKYIEKDTPAYEYAALGCAAGMLALIVKECCDLYSVVKYYSNDSSTEVDHIAA